MDEMINRCLEKAVELNIQDYADGFIVACTDWNEDGQTSRLTFDFYLVIEVDISEGRLIGMACANFSNKRWYDRTSEPLDFWVCSINHRAGISQLSYFHPADGAKTVLTPQPIFGFNVPAELVVASANNRKHRDKTLVKKIEPKRKGLKHGRSQTTQNAIRRFIRESTIKTGV